MYYHDPFFSPWSLLIFIIIILFIFSPLRRMRRMYWMNSWQNGMGGTRHPSAQEILAERFAKGELTAEEYEQKMTVLRKHS